MTGQMELDHAVRGDRIDVTNRIEAMIKSVDENIVDIEQDAAVGLLGHGTEEFPFGEPRRTKFHVARYVLEEDRALENVLDPLMRSATWRTVSSA